MPPYEGRQTSAKDIGADDDPSTAGASRPEEDSEYRSPKRQDIPGGATASPADERPTSQVSVARFGRGHAARVTCRSVA